MSDIVHACYCCLMLHIIAVMEHVAMDDGTVKNDIYYDIVRNAPDCEEEEVEICAEAEALYFMQMEEQDVNDRLLQLEFLETLGIMM